MKTRAAHFNIILLLLGLAIGCRTGGQKKELSAIRLYIEVVNADSSGTSKPVPIYRAKPLLVNVETEAFMDERDVEKAEVIDWMDGYAIQVHFNAHGKLVLEGTTLANPNCRIAVLAEFGESRWLAAPLVGRSITDGTFSFTPDATREEAARFVRGLNGVAALIKKNSK